MSAPTSVQARVEQFLVERRQLGFSTRNDGYVLRSFARYVHAAGHRGAWTVELMAAWARSDRHESNDPRSWARRLKKLRTFLRWRQQFEPRTEVPECYLREALAIGHRSKRYWRRPVMIDDSTVAPGGNSLPANE